MKGFLSLLWKSPRIREIPWKKEAKSGCSHLRANDRWADLLTKVFLIYPDEKREVRYLFTERGAKSYYSNKTIS
jgi:hypothetical protein